MLKSVIKTVNRLIGKRITKRTGRDPGDYSVSEEIETGRAGGRDKYLRRLREPSRTQSIRLVWQPHSIRLSSAINQNSYPFPLCD